MASIGTGYHVKCEGCGKLVKGARYRLCAACRRKIEWRGAMAMLADAARKRGNEDLAAVFERSM